MNLQNLNRKIHVYTSLSFFVFIFLFASSGLMLNHRWDIWEYWSKREETVRTIAVRVPSDGSDLAKARDILSQIGVDGEIHTLRHHVKTNTIEIRTTRPGMKTTIKVDMTSGQGEVKTVELNAWELLPAMHVMTGLHSNIPEKKNWVWTQVWSLMMDLTVLAILVLLGTGFYMWLKLRSERRVGLLCLEIGGAVFILVFWFLAKF